MFFILTLPWSKTLVLNFEAEEAVYPDNGIIGREYYSIFTNVIDYIAKRVDRAVTPQ